MNMRFTEETLRSWTYPPSDSEEAKLQNAERLVKETIASAATLQYRPIKVLGEPSAEGVVLFADKDGGKVINYPLQHIENGKKKNADTLRRFKGLVRIFKKINVKMEEDGFYNNPNIQVKCI